MQRFFCMVLSSCGHMSRGINVWIRAGGDIRKVAQHRVQPSKLLSYSNDPQSNESYGSAVLFEKEKADKSENKT